MTAASLRFLSFRPQGEIFYRFLTPFGMTEKNAIYDGGKNSSEILFTCNRCNLPI